MAQREREKLIEEHEKLVCSFVFLLTRRTNSC
jgi:hypothetical protein